MELELTTFLPVMELSEIAMDFLRNDKETQYLFKFFKTKEFNEYAKRLPMASLSCEVSIILYNIFN